ncbi:uncharacterized protein VTP21DRAFT_3267 [Calcarisporiella thermophila]|uniref:uncharacterized protein n=1 Tax=Calcarisporiella thermophila TaxID=911321 RepID=UPI00374471D7
MNVPWLKKNKEGGPSTPPANPPFPNQPASKPRNGVLLIRVIEGRELSVPPSVQVPQPPPAAQQQAMMQQVGGGGGKRESWIRKQCWWLPYCVVEFDKNEILINPLGGDMLNPMWQYRANFDVSRESDVSISVYLRSPPGSPIGADIFMGAVKLHPLFAQQKLQDEWYPLHGGTGHIRVQLCYRQDPTGEPLTIESFDLLKVIGKGSFGKVMQVRKRDTNRIYAMKIIRKAHIVSRSEVTHTLAERTVLAQINNPFIVPLKFSFQSPEKLYLVLAFINGGELFHHLQAEGRFSEERARFYAAELLCALECLHVYNVIYRDLKPENILIDYNGHIALCDFGLCKLNMVENATTNTFCGTPEYLAPELLLGQGYTKVVDWWTLGILLYEMLTGLPPFYDENTNEMYRKILHDELVFPDEVNMEARGLLQGLLTRDPTQRLGTNGAHDIKRHPFFASIDWRKLMEKKVQPPFKPSVQNPMDTSNFDDEFTNEPAFDSVADDSHLSETVQAQFQGFTYNPSDGMGGSLSGVSVGGGAGSVLGSGRQVERYM